VGARDTEVGACDTEISELGVGNWLGRGMEVEGGMGWQFTLW